MLVKLVLSLDESNACRVAGLPNLEMLADRNPVGLIRVTTGYDKNYRDISLEPKSDVVRIARVAERGCVIRGDGRYDLALHGQSEAQGAVGRWIEQFNVAVDSDLVRPAGGPAGTRLQNDAFDGIDAPLSGNSCPRYRLRGCFFRLERAATELRLS